MDVSAIVSRLTAECPSVAQVVTATTGGTLAPAASQASIYSLLSGLVSNRMYPLQLPESPTHPSIVYQLVSSTPGVFEGYDVTHTDIYILNVRGADYDALLTLVGSIVSALSGENIEITDMLHDYDQAESLYRINLELSISYITSASQTLPAVFVYPVGRSGSESAYDNYTKQLVAEDFALLVVTDGGDMPSLLDEIQAALLGWQQSANHHEVEYGNGAAIEGIGGLSIWRELYRDAFYMSQA